MSCNTVSYERHLEVTDRDLYIIRNDLWKVYAGVKSVGDYKVISEEDFAELANAFNIIDSWSNYYSRYKNIQDSKLYELNKENIRLNSYNEILISENKELKIKLDKLVNDYNEQSVLLGDMKARIEMYDELVKAKDNNVNMVQVDIVELVESLERTLNTIETNAKVITQAKKVKLKGELAPAFNNEVHTEDIIKAYQLGETPNQIAQKCGMTQSAIIYRLKQAGVYVSKGKPGRPGK